MSLHPSPFDLDAYLHRIGYTGERGPTLAVLDAVHLAHATTIPFENLDIQLGRPIRVDLASLQDKLVRQKRGGYCFEQNTLLKAALEALGFRTTTLLARVRRGATRVLPRTHMVLRVEVQGQPYLADVGFGVCGLLRPIPFRPCEVARQFGWSYRLVQEPGLWALQSAEGGSWQDLYAFTLEPQYPVDVELCNWYTSTHPESRFVLTLTVQRSTPEARYVLRGTELAITDGQRTTVQNITDNEDALKVISETFGLTFPPGTRFRCLEGASKPPVL